MKYLASLLLILFLGACSRSSVHTVKEISCQINNCCTKLSSAQSPSGFLQAACPESADESTEPSPIVSFPDFGPEILTW
jgi:hypothetical protein